MASTYDVTCYEAVLSVSGTKYLVAYCYPRSRRTLISALLKRRDAVWALIGDRIGDLTWDRKTWRFVSPDGTIWYGYSGRTERQAKHEGRLPYVGDLHKAAV